MDDRYDVVIVGGGHNGLIAGTYLSKAGKRVLVVEQAAMNHGGQHDVGHLGGTEVGNRFVYRGKTAAVALRRQGRLRALDTPIGVSPRRWERDGWIRRTVENRLLALGFALGVNPARLARRYRSAPGSARPDAGGGAC